MIEGKHLQLGTNRELFYQAFHALAGPRVFVAALIFDGNRLIAKPDFEVMYQPALGSVGDVVLASVVRFIDDTAFGEGEPSQSLFGRVY